MSMEIYVLSPKRLQSIHEWQHAVDKYDFPIKFDLRIDFDKVSGFLPLQFRGKLSGFECDHWSIRDIEETYDQVTIDPHFKHALAFRWGGDFSELVSALQAAAAYAVATDGVVFDCQEGEINSATKAVEVARETEAALPQIEAAMERALDEFKSKK